MGNIREKILATPPGQPFSPSEFLQFGSRAAVDQALSRLVRQGLVSRVARGIYARPEVSQYVGSVPVSARKLAEAVARARGTRLQMSGAEAANRLGLSTQVPAKPVFLTEGPSRVLRSGTQEIELRRAGRRRLLGAGTPAGTVISALYYLGRKGMNEKVIQTIASNVSPEVSEQLTGYIPQVPAWMAESIWKLSNTAGTVGR